WASCTEPASLTWYWLRSSRRRRAERMMVSSSTIRMCGIDSILSTVSNFRGRRYDMPGQGHADPGATLPFDIGRAVDGDLPIMLFRDGIDQSKPKSGAFARILGGEERFEQAVHDVLRDPAALVLDDQVDGVLVRFAAHPHGAAGRRGVTGIGEQVDQHLGQTLGVALDPVVGVAEVEELYFEIAPVQRQQTNGILRHLGQAHRLLA